MNATEFVRSAACALWTIWSMDDNTHTVEFICLACVHACSFRRCVMNNSTDLQCVCGSFLSLRPRAIEHGGAAWLLRHMGCWERSHQRSLAIEYKYKCRICSRIFRRAHESCSIYTCGVREWVNESVVGGWILVCDVYIWRAQDTIRIVFDRFAGWPNSRSLVACFSRHRNAVAAAQRPKRRWDERILCGS